MPIEVVNSVVARIKKTGKWPKMCDSKKMTMKQCGEKVAAIVENKAKKRRALKGGQKGRLQTVLLPKGKAKTKAAATAWAKKNGYWKGTVRETENNWRFRQFAPPKDGEYRTHELSGGVKLVYLQGGYSNAYSTYTQDPSSAYISVEEDGGIWVKVMDHDAALLGADGKPYTLDETALMATLGAWVSPAYDLKGHIDHRPEKEVEIEFMDAKYDLGDGLYVKMKPVDTEVWQSVAEGVMRPSGEFIVPEDPDSVDEEGVVQFVMPTGMGLMWEGEPTSEGAGPGNPSQEAVSAEIVGGEKVSDETTEPEPAPEGGEEEGDQTPSSEKQESPGELVTMKAELDKARKELEDRQKQIDELLAEKDDMGKAREKLEQAEKDRLAKLLPEEYDHEGVSLDQMKRDAALYQSSIEKAKETIVSGPTFQESDELAGDELTDEEYQRLRKEEQEALGFTATIPSGMAPPLPTQPNYRGKQK